MRTALLLPVSTVALAAVGLSLPALPGLRSGPTPPGSSLTARASGAPGLTPAFPRGFPPGFRPGFQPDFTPSSSPADTQAGPRTAARDVAAGSMAQAVPRPPPSLGSRWAWPLAPRPSLVRPFVRPASAYGAGHRGIDLAGSAGQEVLAVEDGTVAHVGRIAGRGTVTVLHPSGVRSTYEPVEPAVTVGDVVVRGSPLGKLEAIGSHCQPDCLHLGAVRDRTYLDPLLFLTGGRRVRLLPLAQAPEG